MVKHRTGYKPSIDEDNQTKDRRIAELEELLDEWIQAYDDYEPFPISDECYVKTSKVVGNKNKREAKQEYEALKKKVSKDE